MNTNAQEWRDEFTPGVDRPAEAPRAETPLAEAPLGEPNVSPGTSPGISQDASPETSPEADEAVLAPDSLPEQGANNAPDEVKGNEAALASGPLSASVSGAASSQGVSGQGVSGQGASAKENAKGGRAKARKPKKPSAATRTEPGIAEKCFNGLSWAGLPVLLVMVALVVFQEFLAPRSLWLFDEVRAADVYMRFLGGDQLALSLNGAPYAEMPPLYFWFLKGLDLIPHVDPPLLFFLGTALSAMLYIGAVWLLARATGHDRRAAFASGLLALTSFFTMGLMQSPNADLLFAALIVLSLICFYLGWIKAKAPVWLTLAFLLAGAATLVKGPLALAFPLIGSVLFLIWRGTPGRLNGRDGLIGFLLMILLIAAWLVMLYAADRTDYIVEIFQRQIPGRMFGEAPTPWWAYLAALPLVCLPWTLLPLFVNWWGALKGAPAAWRSRREQGGSSWLWLVLIAGLALLSAFSAKSVIFLLPLMAPLAVLAGRSLLRLSPLRSRFYFFCTAIVFLLLGLLLTAAHYQATLLPLLPADWTARLNELPPLVFVWLDAAKNLVCMGGVLIILALLLIFLCRRSLPGGTLLLCSVGLLVMNLPFTKNVAPSLDAVLSPRLQAEAMAPLAREGYKLAAYRVSPGAYAYYLNEALAGNGEHTLLSVPDLADMAQLQRLLADNDRVVVAMPETVWNDWKDRPVGLTVLGRQWMLDEACVLVKQDARASGGETNAAEVSAPETSVPETSVPETPASEVPEEAAPEDSATGEPVTGEPGPALSAPETDGGATPAQEVTAPALTGHEDQAGAPAAPPDPAEPFSAEPSSAEPAPEQAPAAASSVTEAAAPAPGDANVPAPEGDAPQSAMPERVMPESAAHEAENADNAAAQ